MLSIGKLADGQEAYYLGKVASGVEDYYVGGGEAEGRWTGSGAAELDLKGKVTSDHLEAMLAGNNPATGQPLQDEQQTMSGPGFDLTFSAPKSVSVLWAFGDEAVRSKVVAAHEAAVDQALGYLERNATLARRGAGGGTFLPAPNLIGAAYRHRTSRAGDPQLHTHTLISKLVKASDDRWTCLHSPSLYANAKTAGFLYQAELRDQLTRNLGVRWGEVRRGSASVEGIEEVAEATFSRRRSEIEAAQAESGTGSRASWQSSVLETRKAKTTELEPGELEAEWFERGAEIGLSRESISHLVGPGRDAPAQLANNAELTNAVTGQVSHFQRRDVIQALCETAPEGAAVTEIEAAADRFLQGEQIVPIGEVAWGSIYTTRELLKLERGFLDAAADGTDAGRGLVSPSRADAILAARGLDRQTEETEADPELQPVIAQQRQMVEALTQGGESIAAVAGVAGAGKTYALAAAHEAWRAEGHTVYGACASWQAADVLTAATGIPTQSIASRLVEWDEAASRGHLALPSGAILVVDEAGMVETRDLIRLREHVEQAKGKLVLVGDYDQLQAVGPGGLFRATYERHGVASLPHSRRQEQPVDRHIVDLISTGHGTEALDLLRATNGVAVAKNGTERDQALVADWWNSYSHGHDAVMIAQTNTAVAELNTMARALMTETDRLGTETIEAAGNRYAAGDLVVTRVNDHHAGVRNLQRWQILDINQQERELRLRSLDSSHEATIGAAYLDTPTRHDRPSLQHGYAVTGHVAQGTTRATVFAQAEAGIYQQWAATALSRARQEMRLYGVVGEEPIERESGPTRERLDWDDLASSLSRDAAETSAADEGLRAKLARLDEPSLAGRLRSLDKADQQAADDRATGERLARRLTDAEGELRDIQAEAKQAPAPLRHTFAERETAARERVENARADLDEFEPLNSPTQHAEQKAERVLIERELRGRRQARVTADRIQAPEYVVDGLGPTPTQPLARAKWIEGVDEIERHRQLYGISDRKSALGPEPRNPSRRTRWQTLSKKLATRQKEIVQLENPNGATRGMEQPRPTTPQPSIETPAGP